MLQDAHGYEGVMVREFAATVRLFPEKRRRWEALQLRIARRADELAREAAPYLRQGPGRLLWMKAESEILSASSRVT